MTKKYAIQDAKLGANNGVTKDAKKMGAKMDTKMDVKKDEKKDAIDSVLRKCIITAGLAPDCSLQLRKNYTKIQR